jgi:GNAT superfamily N-acetyltransferase
MLEPTVDEREIVARVDRAERRSFIEMYTAGRAAGLDTGWAEVGGQAVVWSARDDDPSFSCVIDLADAVDRGGTLAQLEAAARAGGATVIGIDVPPSLAAWATPERMGRLGYALDYQERIQARELTDDLTPSPLPPGVAIERVTPATHDSFARTLNVGYELPEEHVRGYIFASTLGQPNWLHYLVTVDGQPASASVLFISERVADLFVATTRPEWRGRGAQRALIERRLHDGQRAGCDLATSQTGTANASPRNMQRNGFRALYERLIYGKTL